MTREVAQGTLALTGRTVVVLAAMVDEQRFVAKDASFAVLRATAEPSGESVTIIGELASLKPGDTVKFMGRFEEHATYGRRFRADAYTPVLPTSDRGLVRFLGNRLVKGVGEALAQKLVDHFGDATLEIITTQSERLREIPGIGGKRLKALSSAVRARRTEAESFAFLHAVGLGPALARKVFTKYGEAAPGKLRDDPYLAAEEVPGIGFATADRIGREVGIGPADPRRARGALLHALGRAADDGHVYLDRAQLTEAAVKLGVPRELVPSAMSELVERRLVEVEGESVYPPPLHRAEVSLARLLASRIGTRKEPPAIEAAMESVRALDLADKQREAVELSLTARVMVLTGGPGTGKTTSVRAIVRAHEVLGHRIALCAPTGRAAKRLSDACGREAKTVHRMLEWNPAIASWGRSKDDPIEADVVVLDEASMLNLDLALALVSAVSPDATLVFVGDADQLPPIGPGQVLRELLRSVGLPNVRLDRIFRQAESSAIVRGAHEILRGRSPTPTTTGARGTGDLFVIRCADPDRVHEKLLESLRRLPDAYGLDPVRDVQVLSPMRRGALGTEALNELLADALNPGPRSARGFRPGDKVMQLVNDYEREVWNGDVGSVTDVRDGVTYASFDGKAVSYPDDDLGDLTLAYAATVHKAQGSEFPCVVLVMHGSHHVLLTRPLLYTAVTRGKRLVIVLGDEHAIARAARTAASTRTNCRLAERLDALRR
jgi:exodeoxyribonuclease V alpha subunit